MPEIGSNDSSGTVTFMIIAVMRAAATGYAGVGCSGLKLLSNLEEQLLQDGLLEVIEAD